MAVPFRKVSKTRKRMRRSHMALKPTGLIECSNCKAMIRSHRACPKCGYYKKKNVLEPLMEEETKKEASKKEVTKKAPVKKETAKKAPAKKTTSKKDDKKA